MTETMTSDTLSAAPVGAVEGSLIDESLWGAIRALRQQGVSKKGIAGQLDLDVKTVRKWLRQPWRRQRRPKRGSVLDEYESFLKGRAPEVAFNAQVLHRELLELGYRGSYPSVVRYIRRWRQEARQAAEATLRFETDPGEQAQVDWGSTALWLGEERVRVHLFVMVLGYSRRIFARAYRSEKLDCLLDGHEQAFSHFGGRPQMILYDNPRTVVLSKDESSGHVVWNGAFKDRLDFYGVEPRVCRYYRAQTKGKVESGVKYVKRNALAGRRFRDLDDLNTWLLKWCVRVADQRVHGTTGEKPADRFARAEAKALVAIPRRPASRERVECRVVPRDAYVALDTNRYPLPLTWVGHQVEVQVLDEELVFHLEGDEAVRHPRLFGKRQVARWRGGPRRTPSALPRHPDEPPQFDLAYVAAVGEVEVRPLHSYEEVSS